jgi:hypothetical protein
VVVQAVKDIKMTLEEQLVNPKLHGNLPLSSPKSVLCLSSSTDYTSPLKDLAFLMSSEVSCLEVLLQ